MLYYALTSMTLFQMATSSWDDVRSHQCELWIIHTSFLADGTVCEDYACQRVNLFPNSVCAPVGFMKNPQILVFKRHSYSTLKVEVLLSLLIECSFIKEHCAVIVRLGTHPSPVWPKAISFWFIQTKRVSKQVLFFCMRKKISGFCLCCFKESSCVFLIH